MWFLHLSRFRDPEMQIFGFMDRGLEFLLVVMVVVVVVVVFFSRRVLAAGLGSRQE
jgi:hypothetical protein